MVSRFHGPELQYRLCNDRRWRLRWRRGLWRRWRRWVYRELRQIESACWWHCLVGAKGHGVCCRSRLSFACPYYQLPRQPLRRLGDCSGRSAQALVAAALHATSAVSCQCIEGVQVAPASLAGFWA